MRRLIRCLSLGLLLAGGCDQPDEVYRELPKDFDPSILNGLASASVHYDGDKGFTDTTQDSRPDRPTVEVCTDSELADRWASMVNQPIIPMVGAGGLDMTGGAEWAGLTVDEAQSPDVLCQASYYADGVVAWGDYYEVIAFWDTTTRQIDDMLLTPGYKGVITAGAYVFEVNEAITKDGVALSRNDGSDRDPKTDDNMRDIDRALIRAFRPELDADQIDCVEAGACYILDFGTVPTMVFMSVGLYLPLEPQQQHVTQIEVSLKRPFRIGAGRAEVDAVTPTFFGTAAAGIPNCEVTYGTTWGHIESECLAGDALAMAQITPVYGYEQILVQMGGVSLYLERPGLAADEILPFDPVPQADDRVAIASVNAAYEGEFSMPFSEVLRIYRDNLEQAIRDEAPGLAPEDPTGVEQLRTPDDPDLPAEVAARYPDRLRPGGIFAAFCADDGADAGTEYDSCITEASGRPVLALTGTLRSLVSAALGPALTPKLADSAFYVQQLQRALGEYLNGAPILDDQISYSAEANRPDRIYATISLLSGGEAYTYNVYYGGTEDRIHFMNFQRGATRMERVLLRDAALPTPSDRNPSGVFTLRHLIDSPRLGLGAIGTVTVDEVRPETRRALLTVTMGDREEMQVLAPYLEASNVNGYWVPVEGPHSRFEQAHYFGLYGNTMSTGFFLSPAGDGSDNLEIVAIDSTDFFGDIPFCGFTTRIGAFADELLTQIEDAGYPCQLIVRRSENRQFITSLSDLDAQVEVFVSNNLINEAFVWSR